MDFFQQSVCNFGALDLGTDNLLVDDTNKSDRPNLCWRTVLLIPDVSMDNISEEQIKGALLMQAETLSCAKAIC